MAPKPKSWFVRQKVLGANIHETEGLLERNIAVTLCVCGFAGYVSEYECLCVCAVAFVSVCAGRIVKARS